MKTRPPSLMRFDCRLACPQAWGVPERVSERRFCLTAGRPFDCIISDGLHLGIVFETKETLCVLVTLDPDSP